MADKKISQLSGATTPLAGTEVLPIVQSSSTVKVSIDNITKGRTVNATTFDTDVAAAGVTLTGTTLSADGTDTNIDINITPKGTGEVNLTKVDIDAGTIDGTAIGGSSASTAVFTQLDVDNIRIDGNTISSTNTDGNISLTPNGSGGVITGNLTTGNTVVVGSGSAFTGFNIQSSAAGGADVSWRTGTSNRWVLSKLGAETGGDAGSNLFLYRYTDAGGYGGNPLTITRSNGNISFEGNLVVGTAGKGIDFSANSHAAGMTSELLNWYEEGTWTPTYEGSSGSAGAVAYSEQAGSYTRIGNRVILTGTVILTNNGDWTGDVRIGGIPFNASTASGSEAMGSVQMRNVTTTGAYVVADLGRTDGGKIAFINVNSAGASTGVACADVPDNGAFLFTIVYRVA